MVGKGAVGLHLFAQRFRQIDIKTDDLVAGIQRFKRRIGGGHAKIDFIRSGRASGEGGK
ncbi:osmosensitive K+ channel histidine kinase KdpD [Klebsiella pneumoniae]|nr:osmosensitive K+ channel histidine kinase KdpD [Klebsiella pneumoniae]